MPGPVFLTFKADHEHQVLVKMNQRALFKFLYSLVLYYSLLLQPIPGELDVMLRVSPIAAVQ